MNQQKLEGVLTNTRSLQQQHLHEKPEKPRPIQWNHKSVEFAE